MFAAEVILGNFAVSSLTPIVIAAVIANMVAQKGIYLIDPSRINHNDGTIRSVFPVSENFAFDNVVDLPLYLILGLLAGIAAVAFTKFVYATEDVFIKRMPRWYVRAIVAGLIVGVCGMLPGMRSLYGVGYLAVEKALAMTTVSDSVGLAKVLLGLLLLKYVTTSVTLAGGGSGGIFAPSLFLGAMLGGLFGLMCGVLLPGMGIKPGAFAVVGMASVVAGTTHGPLSAVLILFEMTNDYNMILPLMCAAGLASVVSRAIDPDSIYLKKLSRRGELTTWSHHVTGLEDVHVRDLMIVNFATVPEDATMADIIKVATENPKMENLPVMNSAGQFQGVIRAEDLHRLLDSDMSSSLLRAHDIVQPAPTRLSPEENLLDAMQGFGYAQEVESLPVVIVSEGEPRLIGMLPRSRVMRRYRQEMLRHHHSRH